MAQTTVRDAVRARRSSCVGSARAVRRGRDGRRPAPRRRGRARAMWSSISASIRAQPLVGRGRGGGQVGGEADAGAVDADQPPGEADAEPLERGQVDVAVVGAADQLQRRLAAGRVPGRRPRRWSGRTCRSGRATTRCPCRGSGGAGGCGGRRPARRRGRPRASSSASCTPVADAPTTSTPPVGQLVGVAVRCGVSCAMAPVEPRRPRPGRAGSVAPSGGDHDVARRATSPSSVLTAKPAVGASERTDGAVLEHRRVEGARRSRSGSRRPRPRS